MKPTDDFFAGPRYAVFGARARGRFHGPLLIAALRHAGKQVAVIEDRPAAAPNGQTHTDIAAAGPVAGAVILPPSPWNAAAEAFTHEAVEQCRAAGVPVWIYPDGHSAGAAAIVARAGIDAVVGRCPCLHIPGGGFPHGTHRLMLQLVGRLNPTP